MTTIWWEIAFVVLAEWQQWHNKHSFCGAHSAPSSIELHSRNENSTKMHRLLELTSHLVSISLPWLCRDQTIYTPSPTLPRFINMYLILFTKLFLSLFTFFKYIFEHFGLFNASLRGKKYILTTKNTRSCWIN